MLSTTNHLFQQANTLLRSGNSYQALPMYVHILKTEPSFIPAHLNYGTALFQQGFINLARTQFELAVKINPKSSNARHALGQILSVQGELKNAIAHYQKGLQINPHHHQMLANLVHSLHLSCSWSEIKPFSKKLYLITTAELKSSQKTSQTPFANLIDCNDPQRNFEVAQRQAQITSQSVSQLREKLAFKHVTKKINQRLHIGYISADFKSHPVTHHFKDILIHHNRQKYQIFCYSYGANDKSVVRQQVETRTDVFRDIQKTPLSDAAQQINQDQIHILVDLSGWTRGNRLQISALHPAPIQAHFLGFPGTTGADFIDYFITDRIITPPEDAPHYSESFAYLPHCLQPNSYEPQKLPKTTRKEHGLPEDAFVFASFNNSYKIDSHVFTSWMNILKAVPQSVLWLRRSNSLATKNLQLAAKKRGVNKKRLIFSKKVVFKEHFARHQLADLSLDTWNYTGGATTSNSLWVGVPVITKIGHRYVERTAASLLTHIDLPELITQTPKQYQALAIDLATNPDKLKIVKLKIENSKNSSPLFDSTQFTRNLEELYERIWNNKDARIK